ncbi:succinyl-diaminopimelate desuccinylase [Bacillus canaveralius]|uniref:Succinyl-diaminopimelate desuccinylase n=1 Tax=Bacillus canaveralius TaxID=1403243 RepID=A0A2N5GJY2_9BACI|nr:M20 family metallopeptidase [Bacillus canaveralius]PLR81628.1 succinyl-diaminopimelate desuccinylase [Bacillus canaveralius]PLR89909.1 succinyl-diaminopimelate desuccinylase [Bacillus canaveralius]
MVDYLKAIELIDEREAINFLRSLININSVTNTGSEKAVSDVIKDRLKRSNLTLFPDPISEKRENLIVSYNHEMKDEDCKTLIFSGHFDTVPPGNVTWNYGIFEGEIKENKLFGRGTTDMKSGVAAMVMAIECIEKAQIKLNGNLRFVGTVGEEVDCFGAKRVIRNGQVEDATAIVIGEPTANKVKIAHKGVLWLKISIFGKTAHGSMPSLGVNAIWGMNHFINELRNYSLKYEHHPILGESTINIGMIQGGVSTNVVPDQCTIYLDIRTVPGQNHEDIERDIKTLVEKTTKQNSMSFQMETINDLACVHTANEDPFIGLAKNTNKSLLNNDQPAGGVNYYTDGSIYNKALPHVPILIYGPGEPEIAHQPDEWVDLQKYIDSIKFYIKLAVDYLA